PRAADSRRAASALWPANAQAARTELRLGLALSAGLFISSIRIGGGGERNRRREGAALAARRRPAAGGTVAGGGAARSARAAGKRAASGEAGDHAATLARARAAGRFWRRSRALPLVRRILVLAGRCRARGE